MLGVELVKSKVQYIGAAAGCIRQSSPALDYQPPSQFIAVKHTEPGPLAIHRLQ